MAGAISGPFVRLGQIEPAALAWHREFPLPMPPWRPLGPAGIASLETARLSDMPQPGAPTQAHLFAFDNAAIATRCGVTVMADGRVILDTLDHKHVDDAVMRSETRATVPAATPLAGCWLSLLLGGTGNLFHFALMNVGRLALLGGDEIAAIDGVLVPDGLSPAFATLLDRALEAVWAAHDRAPPPRIAFGPATSLRPERLILPLNVAEVGYYLPQTLVLLRALAPRVLPARSPRAIYVDRRDSKVRPLRNEGAVVDALAARGIVPVRLAGLGLDEQAALFAGADLIVAPHGAGLTNLAFARPGTRVIELMPDRLANWCYRRLAAALGLHYEAIIGAAEPLGAPGLAAWQVAPGAVLVALD